MCSLLVYILQKISKKKPKQNKEQKIKNQKQTKQPIKQTYKQK